jgi:phage shock protein PspC (stress-responsive transcriptional regulator)
VNQRRLYRSTDDRILAGVCGGVAAYFDVDPVIVRIIWFLSIFFTGTLTFWAYVVMIIVVPAEPDEWQPGSPWAPGGAPVAGAPGAYPANYAPVADPNAAAAASPDAGAAAGAAPAEGTAPTDPNAAPSTAAGFTASQPNQWTPGPGDWRWQRRADRWQRRADRWERRERGNGGLIFGLLLIVVGGLLAWHQVDPNVDLGLLWPLGVIALGVLLVASSFRLGGRS